MIFYIKTELDNISVQDSTKDPVVVIQLHGKKNTIEVNRIVDYITEKGALLTNIIDNRVSNEIDLSTTIEEQDIVDIEQTIDSEIEELDISDTTHRVNDIIRNKEIADSNVRDIVTNEIIGDTQ